jgi:L-asparaginase
MSDKHISLIYTGGTVGMTKTASGYAPMPDFPAVLEHLLGSPGNALPRFTLVTYPQPIDSANAAPTDWQTIGRDIAARYDDHDGFVVLHGTDTMAFTASALSFMLQGLRKPVILTGSQIPLEAARSDAMQNLVGALQLAACPEPGEVALYFNQRLLRGNRSTKISSEAMHAFDSPNYPALAHIGIDVDWNRPALLSRAQQERFELPDYGAARVLSLRFAPGMPRQALDALLACGPQALILECYGAGNAPDRDPALLESLARAGAAGTVIVARSQCAHGKVAIGTYAAGAGMATAGVIGAADMSFEAVYTKLHHLFALGLTSQAVRAAMQRNLAGELTA